MRSLPPTTARAPGRSSGTLFQNWKPTSAPVSARSKTCTTSFVCACRLKCSRSSRIMRSASACSSPSSSAEKRRRGMLRMRTRGALALAGRASAPPRVSGEGEATSASGLYHLAPERQQRQHAELERLHAEGNADDRQAQQHARGDVREEELPAEEHEPDDVDDQLEQPARARLRHDGAPEGPEREARQLERLHREGDADD